MDFFSSSFNAEMVLNDIRLSSEGFEIFGSIDKFEQHLLNTNIALVGELQKLELQGNVKKLSR